jgi:hypothetical protein
MSDMLQLVVKIYGHSSDDATVTSHIEPCHLDDKLKHVGHSQPEFRSLE